MKNKFNSSALDIITYSILNKNSVIKKYAASIRSLLNIEHELMFWSRGQRSKYVECFIYFWGELISNAKHGLWGDIIKEFKIIMPSSSDEQLYIAINELIFELGKQSFIKRKRIKAKNKLVLRHQPCGSLNKKTYLPQLINQAHSTILPIGARQGGLCYYSDLRIIDGILVGIYIDTSQNFTRSATLVYQINGNIKLHRIRRVTRVEDAIKSIKHVDVRWAEGGYLDGSKVRKVWNDWENKLFYIDVEGKPLSKIEWRHW